MDGFLKIAGGLIFWVALAAIVIVGVVTQGSGLMLAFYAAPIMISGAATYALGAILNNLIAIRESSDRQAAALSALIANQRHD